jgi:hypothetical protein
MKLFNETPIPDNLIYQLALKAAERVDVKHEGVAVKVAAGKKNHGWFCQAYTHKHGWRKLYAQTTDCIGWITAYIPMSTARGVYQGTPLNMYPDLALNLYGTLVHEFKHAADHQSGEEFNSKPKYRERPQEKRAYEAQEQALAVVDSDDDLKQLINQIQTLVNTCRRWKTVK